MHRMVFFVHHALDQGAVLAGSGDVQGYEACWGEIDGEGMDSAWP